MPRTDTPSRSATATVTAAVISTAIAVTAVGLVSAPAWADTTAAPVSARITAAPSYATTTFHDEWDYSNTDDLLIDNSGPSIRIASPRWSGGVLSYIAEPSSYVSPLWGGYPGSLFQNRDGALPANHITASQYDHISIHAFSSAAVSSAIQWFDSPQLNSSTEGGHSFELEPGWHEYDIPLGKNEFSGLHVNWAGTIEGIRFATSPTANTAIKLDFMRLYKAGADAGAQASWNVSGDPAQPYWSSTGAATSCPTPSQTCGPVQDAAGIAVPASTGALSVDASAYPAGTTLFLATPDGGTVIPGTSVVVQPRPQPIVDTPSAKGCGDFATSTFGHPWLSSKSTFSVGDATSVKLSGGRLSATNTSNDPHVYLATGSGINANVWRYLSVTEIYSGNFNLLDEPGGGTMARVLWATPGRGLSQSQDLLTYLDRPTINVDLRTPASTLVETDASVRYGWGGSISDITQFRWDPNEDPGRRAWALSDITLGRECTTGTSSYSVTWHDPGWVSGTTATVEAVPQGGGSTVVLGRVAEASGENHLAVRPAVAPLGDYTIRVISAAPTAGVTASGNSATPLRITVPVSRVAGADRYDTGVEAAQAEFPKGASTVLLASGTNYPDALTAAPAAAAAHGALLLTQPNTLTTAVAAELRRLKPTRVYIIGGASAVSPAVAARVKSVTGVTAVRIAGSDRYGTSAAIAARFFPSKASQVLVATGAGFPDALSAASAAARLHSPVLLVPGTSHAPTSAVSAQLRRLRPSTIYAVGGGAVISSSMTITLARTARVTRLAGADRFGTSAAVGAKLDTGASATAYLASGVNFPDALVGSALAGERGAPLFLAQDGCLSSGVQSQLTRLTAKSLTLVGGAAVLSTGLDQNHCSD